MAELIWKVSVRGKEQTQARFLCYIIARVLTHDDEDIREAAESWVLSGETGLMMRRAVATAQIEVQ